MSCKFIFPDHKLAIINLLLSEAKNIKQRNALSLYNYPDIAIILSHSLSTVSSLILMKPTQMGFIKCILYI